MKVFVRYTLARLALFGVVYGLIWLAFGYWIAWNALSALYTAIIAMVVSSLLSILMLKGMRAELAVHVEARAARAKAAYDASRAAEDDDSPSPS